MDVASWDLVIWTIEVINLARWEMLYPQSTWGLDALPQALHVVASVHALFSTTARPFFAGAEVNMGA
jgi:hypothetical protein